MSYKNNIINADGNGNVPVSDIQKALCTTADKASKLCMHDSIEWWSYYKPIRAQKFGTIPKQAREEMFYKANDGFIIPVFDSPKYAVEALENGNADWVYEKPRGGRAEPFRLSDFDGYNSAATNWFLTGGLTKYIYRLVYSYSFPEVRPISYFGMIAKFKAFADNNDAQMKKYNIGLLAWVAGDSSKRAYFINFGTAWDLSRNQPSLYIDLEKISGDALDGMTLKFASAITSFDTDGTKFDEPYTDGIIGGLCGSWNPCILRNGEGGNNAFESEKSWWIMPAKPFEIPVDTSDPSNPSTRPLPDYFTWEILSGYPKVEKVILEDGNNTFTGYNVRIKAYAQIREIDGRGPAKLYIAMTTRSSGGYQYVFENTFEMAMDTVGLEIPANNHELYNNGASFDWADHSLVLFIPKDQVGSDRKIQLTVEIHVGNRAGYANDTILRISDLTAPPEI